MGRTSQRKGRAGELELAATLRGYGYTVQPGAPANHGRTPDIVGLSGFHIECKRREKLDLPTALRQSAADVEKFGDGWPIVAHRANRQGWIISMTLDTFMSLNERTINDKSGKGGSV